MSLMTDMAIDDMRKTPSSNLLGDVRSGRMNRSNLRGDGVITGFGDKNKKRFSLLLTPPSEKRELSKNKPLGLGALGSSAVVKPMGENLSRRQIGVSSKSRLVGGSRFDYDRPTQGYFYNGE
jgi:hypothetical protein